MRRKDGEITELWQITAAKVVLQNIVDCEKLQPKFAKGTQQTFASAQAVQGVKNRTEPLGSR